MTPSPVSSVSQSADQDIKSHFCTAMRRLASTVSIVTCQMGDEWHGMTATAVTSVCADPATILVCINQSASIHQPLVLSGHFCVNLLQSDQAEAAQAFSGKLKGSARFALGEWDSDTYHLPALRHAQANIFCTLVETLAHGTHSIFIGSVDGVRTDGQVAPLIYQNGDYSRAVSLKAA